MDTLFNLSALMTLAALCCAPLAHANSVSLPELRGRLFNRTAYDSQSLGLSIKYDCLERRDWWSDQDKLCGTVTSTARLGPVQADGSQDVVFPAVTLHEPGFGASAILAFVSYSAPQGAAEKSDPFDFGPGLTQFRLRANGKPEEGAALRLAHQVASIAVYQFPSQRIRFSTADGRDAISYLRTIYGPQDSLRVFIKAIEPGMLNWEDVANLPVSLGPQSFGHPIETLSTSGVFKLALGAPPADALALKLVVRIEPYDWRDYNWGRSWKIVHESEARLELESFRGTLPRAFTELPVSESWVKR